MQTVVLSTNESQHNIAPIDKLTQVADIESSAVDDGRFADSGIATKADEEGSVFKLVAAESDLTSAIPAEESGYFVAIKDYAADIQDMSLHFVGAASPYRLFVDQFSNQWHLMQTAMQLSMFGASDEINMPSRVKRNHQELAFYSDMAEYYESSTQLDLAVNNKGAIQSGYPARFSAGVIESSQNTQSAIAQSIQDKYGISASRFGYYEKWIASDRWRTQLNWKQMLSEMQAISEQKEIMLAQVTSVKRDFISVLESLTPHHLERVFDLYSEETQYSLYQLHLAAVEAFSLVIEEEDRVWAESQWEKPTSLLPLYTSGFSRSVYNELEKSVPEPLSTSPKDEDKWLEHVSSVSNKTGMYAKVMDFATNPNTSETDILKDLAKGFKELDTLFKASISAALKGTLELGVSVTSQASILLMPTLAKPLTRNSFVWRATIAERMARTMPLSINDNYAQEFKDWKTRIEDNLAELKKNNRIIAEVNQNQRKATTKYKDALKKQRQLKKSLAVTTLEYPQRIVLPDDLAKATVEFRVRIINEAANDLHKLFENAGGLGFLALLFNCIALTDAMSSIADTGLMTSDEFLDVQQKLFYTASAWTGIRTGKLWDSVKGDPRLRARSYKVLKELVSNNSRGFENLILDDLKVFNKWLAITGALGALASGIEAYRSFQMSSTLSGEEKAYEYMNFSALSVLTLAGTAQAIGATGLLTVNFTMGGPMMFIVAVATAVYLSASYLKDKVKKDDYQKWLSELPWGYDSNRAQWSNSPSMLNRAQENSLLVQNALFELESIIQQPIVFHKPIERIQAFPQYTHRELVGLEVHIQIPKSAAYEGIKLQTNTKASEEDLMSGSWHINVDLETLKPIKEGSKDQVAYKLELPIEAAKQYFALKVGYELNEEAANSREYCFQNSIKQRASYAAISDNEKQNTIKKSLTPIVGILGIQE
jgi:hypothetical protein